MVKTATLHFACQSCGEIHSKWSGRCSGCGEWNTLVEESTSSAPGGLKAPKSGSKKSRQATFTALNGEQDPPERIIMGVDELDRVFGGGIVPNSATLIGGDPGIGKSLSLIHISEPTRPY